MLVWRHKEETNGKGDTDNVKKQTIVEKQEWKCVFVALYYYSHTSSTFSPLSFTKRSSPLLHSTVISLWKDLWINQIVSSEILSRDSEYSKESRTITLLHHYRRKNHSLYCQDPYYVFFFKLSLINELLPKLLRNILS